MVQWDKGSTWIGEGLRREVFFFTCGGVELYGSLYAAEPMTRSLGTTICNSWGIEGDQANRLVHPMALSLAQAGGAGLVFHYPGCGDSHGAAEALTLDAMTAAAAAAVAEGQRRLPGVTWMLAGTMLGASVAALAAPRVEAEALLLVQPALRPGEYFDEVRARARRIGALTRSGGDTVFGYRPSPSLLASAAATEPGVAESLREFRGNGAMVRYSSPKGTHGVPEGFEQIEVEGTWRFAAPDDTRLGKAAAEWLTEYAKRRE